jgi:L-ribulose-5-phosphate 4-epimerase
VSYDDLREQAFEANLELVRAGLVVLTFGNASAIDRSAGALAIKPSGVLYDELSPDAMVVVDIESGEVIDGSYRPSSDTPTHLVLCRRFAGIGGVVHTHSPYATAWAQAGRDVPCYGTTHADHFHGSVPVTRPLVRNEIEGEYEHATGEVIAETLERLEFDPLEMPATLVSGHGPFVWGADASAAVENAVALEVVAASAYRMELLQPALPHSTERSSNGTSCASTGPPPTTDSREGASPARARRPSPARRA